MTAAGLACEACSRAEGRPLVEREGFQIWRCSGCGHGWVAPGPDAEALRRYYESEQAVEAQYVFPERSARRHASRLFRWIGQVKSPPGRIVDVGGGTGVQLEVARALGWDGVAVEWSDVGFRACQARGLGVVRTTTALDSQAFDVVTAWEVIEHQPDPPTFLLEARRLLRRGGLLALSTPNFQSVRARLDYAGWYELRPPMHLSFFTPQSLRLVVERAGFVVVDQKTFTAWSPVVDRAIERAAKVFGLDAGTAFLIKIACYKLSKPYFDRGLQSKLQGLGLLTMATWDGGPGPRRLRKYFYA